MSHPNAADKNKQAAQWFRGLLVADVAVLVPEIADYELRRELLHVDKARSVAVLDRYKASLGYVSLTTEAMLLAAQLRWVHVGIRPYENLRDLAYLFRPTRCSVDYQS